MSSSPAEPARVDAPGAVAIGGFYALLYMALGVTLPFMPAYLRGLGLSATQVGVVLAVGPVFAIVAPPLWGQIADRSGRPGRVLALIAAGAALGLAGLAGAQRFTTVLAAFALNAVFGAAISTLIDAIALDHLRGHTGRLSYGVLRACGSAGFVVSSLAFGFAIDEPGRATVLVPLGLTAAAAAWATLGLGGARSDRSGGPRPSLRAAWDLVRRREIALFLTASALHWIACTPYHGSLAPYLASRGLGPRVVSLSAAVAVASELVVMLTYARWASARSARGLLVTAFALSALRWSVMAASSSAAAFVAVATLHGMSFGAYYLASVAWIAERTPGSLRASGQAGFVAVTFGVGGLIGYLASGRIYDALGGAPLFALAAAVEIAALVVVAVAVRAR